MPTLLTEQIDTLAAFTPTELPVISLYLNTQSDDHGRDHFGSFVKKELHTRAGTFAPQSAAHASFVKDVERIEKYLARELRPSTNGADTRRMATSASQLSNTKERRQLAAFPGLQM